MTPYEYIFWVGFIIWTVCWEHAFQGDYEKNKLMAAVMTIYLVLGMMVAMVVSNHFSTPLKTASVPAPVKYADIQNGKLTILLEDNSVYTFSDYDTITKWKNGAKFNLNYYFTKSVFGPDFNDSKLELNQ